MRCTSILLIAFITYIQQSHSKIRHARGRAKRQEGEGWEPSSWIWGDEGGGQGGGDWGHWSPPSPCSRPCGGGVANQTRICRSSDCWGSKARYFSCNTDDCGDGKDFRTQQCAEYNDIPYEGINYDWIPYTKAPDQCALNCMPRGERFYYRHSDIVVDGTLCSDESLDVCVNGKCKHVGCDKMLGSQLEEDKCRVCGGDGSSCDTKRDTLTTNEFKVGYNDLFMLPAGATNIRVREVHPSNNYLAIRNASNHYYLNGNWHIDYPRILRFAGTVFHYGRKPHGFFAPESISALGPTTEILFIVLLYQERNPGIEYEYNLPKGTVVQTDPEGYTWFTGELSECSSTCGGGFQSRRVWCAKVKDSTEVSSDLCDPAHEPASTESCSTQPCPPQWHTPEWSPCSVSCGNGTQSRQIYCEQVVSGGQAILLNESVCLESVGDKPESTQSCGDPLPCPMWHIGPWKPCDKLCGDGVQRRMVQCYRKVEGKIELLPESFCSLDDRPEIEKPCNLRPCEGVDWITGEWSGCSNKCGLAFETREVLCANQEGKIFNDSLCHEYRKPELKQVCNQSEACPSQWYTSQWSPCSSKCGPGVQTRHVFCGSFSETEGIVKKVFESECDESKKSEDQQPCQGEEECKGEWFVGDYGQCSKPCGGGQRSRKTLCFKNNQTVKYTECEEDSAVFDSSPCNTHPCGEDEILPVEPDSSIMEESSEECEEGEEGEESGEDGESGEGEEEESAEDKDKLKATTKKDMDETPDAESFENVIDLVDVRFGAITPVKVEEADEGSGDMSTLFTESGPSSTVGLTEAEASTSGVSESSSDSTTESSSLSTDQVSSESSVSDSSGSTESSIGSTDIDMSSVMLSDGTSVTFSDVSSSEDSSKGTVDSSTLSVSSDSTSSADMSSTTDVMTSTSDSPSTTETSVTTDSSTISSSDSTSDGTTESSTESMTSTDATSGSSVETSSSSDSTESSSESSWASTVLSSLVSLVTDSSSESSSTTSDGLTSETVTEASQATDASSEGVSDATDSTSESISDATDSTSETSDVSSTSPETTAETGLFRFGDASTDTSASTESGPTETDMTEDTDATTTSWSGTLFGVTSSVESAVTKEQTVKKCKKRPKIKKCVKSEFGCCPDSRTPAKGPFGKDCPKVETCKDSKYGCCPDGVSPASGHKFSGCPPSLCSETLFGCCPNGIDEALGNDYEGCPTTTTLAMDCSSSEFGCCPDGILSASGPNYAGCFECEGSGPCESCNDTKWGCCPDNINQATGPDFQGCEMPMSTTESLDFTMGVSEECENSTYGCCPDGVRLATGPDDEGCETTEEPPLHCFQTKYGCCPDGNSTASGPKYEGCDTSCSNEPYGCCDDSKTPAHGPNKEGCCLNTAFGCCKDNVLPAQGPNYEGCRCDSSLYGCCPDGRTAATGPDNDGCGCDYTVHGCCPDKATPAAGPDYEGCPCYTYQFGCCPDGKNHAVGPRMLGCGCENTEFGCCSDGKTPKPDSGNCTCESSPFGCCMDGITEAKGDKFEECATKPRRPGDICGLPKDRGPCREFIVKWHYDTEYGGCSRFWFGSCDGNGNKFNSQEECKQFCVEPKGRDACSLPKIEGPCQGYYPRWYYDPVRKDCNQFIYGGCLGNNNKFQTVEECRELCVIPDNLDGCDQELDVGPCEGRYSMWYYNKEHHACYPFEYGGCKGNKNRFLTESACSAKCLSPQRQKSECSHPKSEGDCSAKVARWYFDNEENRCMPFYYTGCGGNDNNFAYIEHCQQYCPPRTEVSVCALPPLEGDCHNFTIRFYFDSLESKCKQFYYGGCGGNTNNFGSEFDCYRMCEPSKLPDEPELPFSIDMCLLPYESGPCGNAVQSWFFDSRDGSCKEFTYGGCQGNGNRFSSFEECESRCEGAVDICRLGTVQVRCDSATSPSWYYDAASESCRQYADTMCPGNGNRFDSVEACHDRCRPEGVRPPPTQAPFLPDICWARLDPGPCLEQVASWWFDKNVGRCQPFQYGGCEGNANRFSSEEQCERQCGQFRRHDTCWEKSDVGSCDQVQRKFFYNSMTASCEEFTYSGCGGNTNRYSTLEECQSVCIRKLEPPITPGQNTQVSNDEICRLSVEPGSCSGYIERYHFDDLSKTCVPFVYTGCSANLNNFNSQDSCMLFCAPDHVVIDLGPNEVDQNDCYDEELECNRLTDCLYGVERKQNSKGCTECNCHLPCDGYDCGSDAICSVRSQTNPVTLNVEYIPVCTPVSKPGRCPEVSIEASCDEACSSDSQCPESEKCCYNGCGTQCLRPEFDEQVTTSHPQHPQGVEPPQILTNEDDTDVQTEEGNVATMRCVVRGSPVPQITWKKDNILLNSTGSKYRMLSDGTLQVIGVIKDDSGVYICVAENGIGRAVTKEFHLKVNDGVPLDVSVIGEDGASVVVELGAPAVLVCRAIGWPRPSISWFRGSHMLPLSSSDLEQARDNSLILHSVALPHLGFYTCQAYNGRERAASYSVALKAIGPAQLNDPYDVTYDQFLVSPPRGPRPPPYLPRPRPTTLPPPPPPTRRYTVPVRVRILLDKTEYTPGQDISIPCDVEGFPTPRTVWYKNGEPVVKSDRISITDSNRLIITSSGVSDEGNYKCHADNNYTSSEASIDIQVKGLFIPTNCTDNPFFANCRLIVQAQYCTHEYYARFCCKSCTEAGQINHAARSKRSIRLPFKHVKSRNLINSGLPLPLLPKLYKLHNPNSVN